MDGDDAVAEMEEEYNDKSRERLVALYEFDPATIDWPFKRQKPLPLQVGQVIQILFDDGGEWALGHPVNDSENKGYFPRNYTVTVAEYNEMIRDCEGSTKPPAKVDDPFAEDPGPQGPAEAMPLPEGAMPVPTMKGTSYEVAEDAIPLEDPEIVYPGLADYPTLEARPPIGTTYELARSKLLREMPPVPEPNGDEPAPPRDDVEAARRKLEQELEEEENKDLAKLKGGTLSYSRCSTPGAQAMTRPERDFVRQQVSDESLQRHLRDPIHIADLVRKQQRLAFEEKVPYKTDLRIRSTTCRIARNIEPAHMKIALQRASGNGAKWTQMFRPGFLDKTNESFKVGCNACLLSDLYIKDKDAREMFQKMYAQDVKGTFWHELERRKKHLFYMRMDFFDVMMCHPDAWGFPDTNRIVSANGGEPINPFHGWFAQHSIDPDKELEDVEFTYSLRMRAFPEQTFQALGLGKVPEWIAPYLTLHAEAQPELDPRDDEADAGPATGQAIDVDNNLMMEAGLEESDDLYVKLDELRLAKERTAAPDVLDVKPMKYRLKGLSAMRIFLRSRGNPDNMKQTLISPKMVKDMSAQLGIRDDPARYWYCLFALRYPQSPEWEVVVRNDTRWYLHLPSDRLQPVHPMIRRFREHLDDCKSNEFLWDYRGFVKMKCSECGLPDSVIWCHQCTDYFCAPCYLNLHKSKRGKKHWPMPVPGSRYLTGAEATRLGSFLPLLNAGFSNRRRFLARDNQSDKNGSRSGDTWLFFHADTFHAALQQAPEKHWYLKRLKPPRLAPGVEGYYYNFQTDILADDASAILAKEEEQKAVSVLQKSMRGALTRKYIKRKTEAAVVIQKTKMMWDVQRIHGSNGKNAAVLKSWYRKWKAKEEKQLFLLRLAKIQGYWRGLQTRAEYQEMLKNLTKFQASFRGILGRRKVSKLLFATKKIQRCVRGMIYGRRTVRRSHKQAAKIQAMYRGVAQRKIWHRWIFSATYIQAHARSLAAKKRVRHLHQCGLRIQRNWRRFQAQLDVKQIIYERVEALNKRRQQVLRSKLEDGAATLFQRAWWRHRDYEKFAARKREKGEADKRTSTMLVALYSASSNLRQYLHPWWRHLPKEFQDVLKSIKGPLQRTIAQAPVTGKLGNEEIGKRGLTVASAEHLVYKQHGREPDLASHLLLSVTRHLLSHVPAEDFPATVKWGCYAAGHQAVDFHNMKGYFTKEVIPVGKELPPHPGDSLSTLYKDMSDIQSRADRHIHLANESLPALMLKRLPTHQRHVFLTAEVLITMRQALDTPSLSTDDHLRFQGVDASAGAQLMEVLGSEIDHRLPLDWPKVHGTVAALAAQAGTHMTSLKPEGDASAIKPKKAPPKDKATKEAEKKAQAEKKEADKVAKAKKKKAAARGEVDVKAVKEEKKEEEEKGEGGILSYFNRAATLRILQQTGYFMCDQDHIMEAVLKRGADDGDEPGSPTGMGATGMGKSVMGKTGKGKGKGEDKPQGVRQSRYVAVTDRLFELADHEKHDHCSFVLAVVVYHMVMRGLMLRLLYHRAAIALQKRYRYLKSGSSKRQSIAPAICIQRFWRGLGTRLRVMYMDDAAAKIQNSFLAYRWNSRARKLLKSALLAQRVWKGALSRKWLRDCQKSAVLIQKNFRRMLVACVYDKKGRELIRKQQQELNEVVKMKNEMSESMYIAKTAVLAAKARMAIAKHRDQAVDIRRSLSFTIKSSHARRLDKQKRLRQKGAVQPIRISIFEPVAIATRRIAQEASKQPARYGAPQSKVVLQLRKARRELERSLENGPGAAQAQAEAKVVARSHAAAKAGRRAAQARRQAKQPKLGAAAPMQGIVDADDFDKWMKAQFNVRK